MAVNDNNKYDELAAMRDKKRRKKRTHLWVILGALAAAAVIVSVLAFNMRGFSSYKPVGGDVVKTDEPGAVYAAYGGGYVRGSHSGVEYVDASGKTQWNEAVTFADPKVFVKGDKIFVADMGGNGVDVFDASGHVGRVETPYSIYEAAGTAAGRVAVMTQDSNSNYLELYEPTGEPVYSVKTALGGDGYPLAFDISSDGGLLAESYVKAKEKPVESGVRFYDFSSGSSGSKKVSGEFSDFDGELTGEICFFDNANVAAVSESAVKFYSTEGRNVSLESEHELFEEYEGAVKRVLKSGERLVLILSVNDEAAPERLVVFGDSGKLICDKELTESYDRYSLEKDQVFMMSSNRFAIYSTGGNEVTRQTSERPVSALIGNGGSRYFLVSDGQVHRIQLS